MLQELGVVGFGVSSFRLAKGSGALIVERVPAAKRRFLVRAMADKRAYSMWVCLP